MSLDLAAIRTHFDTRILTEDSDYIFIDDPFGDDTISVNYGDKNYKLWFGEISQEKNSNTYTQSIPAILEIYSEDCRDNTSAFDTIYQKGIDFAEAIIDPKCLISEENDLNLITLTPSPVESNDKMVKITLTFEIRKDFKFC